MSTSLRAQLMAAHAALVGGQPERAYELAQHALAVQPQLIDAMQLFAGAALALHRYPEAADVLRRAASIAPRSADVRYNLGVAEHAAGRFSEAVAAFRDCLSLRPGHVDTQLALAEALRAAGEVDLAIEAYQAIVARQPAPIVAVYGLAQALSDADRSDDAERVAQTALDRAPAEATSWRVLAQVRERAGDIDGALVAFDDGLKTTSDAYALLVSKGHTAYRANRLTLAAATFARATELQPRSIEAWINLAVCQTALEHVDEAIASARQALALAPDDVAARVTLAAALSRGREPGQLMESLQACEAVLEREPAHATAHDCAAVVHLKLGDSAFAEHHALQAVAHAPGNGAFAITLARVLEQRGDLDGAEAALGALSGVATQTSGVMRQLGHVRLRRGRAQAALDALDEACRQSPDDQAAIAERAVALGATGDWHAAEAWLGLHEWIRPVDIDLPAPFAGLDDFLSALAEDIRRHSLLRYEPVGLVARGGYLTGDLLADDTPAISGFARSLVKAIDRFIAGLPDRPGHPFLGHVPRGERSMHVWATRVREQGVIDTHIHEGSWLSGAYYVTLPPAVGDDGTAGWIEFGMPYPGLPAPPEDRLLRLKPEPGRMFFFPSYVFHRTLPYRGDGERISVSFDLGAA